MTKHVKSLFLALIAVVAVDFCPSLSLKAAPISGASGAATTLTAQQVMNTLAGMRSDVTLALDECKKMSLRIETLEEDLAKRDARIKDLQTLCDSLAQQCQALEMRLVEVQKSVETDQRKRQEEMTALANQARAAASAAATVPAGNTFSLKVERGDTLSSIAKAAGCSVAQIMAANPSMKSPDELRVGQTIQIPKK